MTKKYIIGNWKMNPESLEKAKTIFNGIETGLGSQKKATVVICPSFIHLASLVGEGKHKVAIGAQDFFVEQKGSFTGEVSIAMLRDLGVNYAIIGHSERRKLGETDEDINKKVLAALREGMTPILCIGETVRADDGAYLGVIKEQLEKALAGVSKKYLSCVIVAYEPVWAIGATEAMRAGDVHEMKIFIKKTIVDMYKLKAEFPVSIIYGGSVDPVNAHGILHEGEADGLLIGRQSLDPQSFLEIIKAV